jgi:hypothetical protein
MQQELADLLSAPNNAKDTNGATVTQKFSQAVPKGGSQMPGSQLLDKHYSAYGGTDSQVVP